MVSIKLSTAVEAIAANIIEAKFVDFKKEVVDSAKNRIIDVIGCAIGGANASGNVELIDLIKEWGGKQEASILIHGGKAPAHNVAMANAIMSRSYDYEVMMVLVDGQCFPSHHSPTNVMTAIALGESAGIDGRELIASIIVGDDISARLIAASGIDLGLGWDGTGTFTAFSAAAIAGRLLRLNHHQMQNAFGIVLNNVAGTVQAIWDGATTFKYGQGSAAMNGIIAAKLAKKGWIGVKDPFLSPYGFYGLYTSGCKHPEILTKDLGKKYYAEAVFKAYPCCRATHTTIDAALSLGQRYHFNTEDISSIAIFCSPGFLKSFVAKPFQIRDYPHCDAIFSLKYTCATALLNKCVKQEHFTDAAILSSKINNLIPKIDILPFTEPRATGIEVKLRLKNGRTFSEYVSTAKGDPLSKPLTKDEIIEKYLQQVEFSQTVKKDRAILAMKKIENLEEVNNLSEIINLLV